jgi:trigger factor
VLKPLGGLRVQRLTANPDKRRIERVHELQPHGAGTSAEAFVAKALMRLSRLHLKRQVLDWLASRYDFDVPQTMMEKELSRIRSHHAEQIRGRINAALEERYREIAQRRIRLAIVLLELGKAYNVSIPAIDIEHLVRHEGASDETHNATLIDFYVRYPSALAELQSPQLEDSVVDVILSRAEVTVTDRAVSADELVAAAGLDILDLA